MFNRKQIVAISNHLSYIASLYEASTINNRHWKAQTFYRAASTIRSSWFAMNPKAQKDFDLVAFRNLRGIGDAVLDTTQQFIDNKYKDNTEKALKIGRYLDDSRILRHDAEILINEIQDAAYSHPVFTKVEYAGVAKHFLACGSYRRGDATCGDLDFVTALCPKVILTIMESIGGKFLYGGEKRVRFEYSGVGVDFRICEPETFYSHVLHYTGPAGQNIQMRNKAKSIGMVLNEYGLFHYLGRDEDGNAKLERAISGDKSESAYFDFLKFEDGRTRVEGQDAVEVYAANR